MSLHTPHPDACPPQKTALAIAGMAIVVLGVKVIKDRQDNDAENEAKDLGSKVHILTYTDGLTSGSAAHSCPILTHDTIAVASW